MKIDNQCKRMHPASGTSLIVVLSLALGLAGIAGCEREGPGEEAGKKVDQAAEKAATTYEDAKKSGSEKAEEAGEYMDDAAITGKIKMDILGDPMLKLSQIAVTTTNGVVNLTGIVDSRKSIDRALEIARDVQAVKSVDNGLFVQ
jgi:hyperosmotically inducible periplasmic protein